MEKREMLLAALAAGGAGASFSPVQVQKLLFLIDRQVPELPGGSPFDFQPYNYGPFDRTVYEELESLCSDELAEELNSARYRKYILTPQGYKAGVKELKKLPEEASSYAELAAEWVRGLTFQQLVTAIYRRYPDMKKNSVFGG